MAYSSRRVSSSRTMNSRKRILVAPLDWGLGHATRCIPLIRRWVSEGHEVVLAGEGRTAALLQSYFPELRCLDLPGYRMRFDSIGSVFLQLPKFLAAIRQEHAWLKRVQQQETFDEIISDNRYGLHHADTRCILITHQLYVKAPRGLRRLEGLLHRTMMRWIKRFDECWVPDTKGVLSLSGYLSQLHPPPKHVRFIGPLSRLQPDQSTSSTIPAYDHVIMISGPEPYRSLLQQRILERFCHSGQKTIVICGTPEQPFDVEEKEVRRVSHLDDDALVAVLQNAKHITCSAGYSTLMDLRALDKKATLIPTPGQPEQRYLAQRMHERFGWPVRELSDIGVDSIH